jgi:hypothetical protein
VDLFAIAFYAVLAGALIWGTYAFFVRQRELKRPAADTHCDGRDTSGSLFASNNDNGVDGAAGGGGGGGGSGD